ncbi:hypothetical protein ACT3TH_10540 [Psychrobacter sp. AOP22-C1-C5]|uniref:hypothetical protein n=1 Tax=Psychrobacter sp. AOP22-C1-C5 TaxID=3457716 RepID=UPI0040356E8C
MPSVSKTEDLSAENINADTVDSDQYHTQLYELLKQREQYWWQARQQLLIHRERKMVWYGENSLMMWLLWQLVSYVVVAMVLMLLSNLFNLVLPLWQYIALFILQTVIFIIMLGAKGRSANKLQRKIDNDELISEEAFNEMVILAEDSLYPDVHANSPISLRQVYDYFDGKFHLASIHALLQKEVDAGRLMLTQQKLNAKVLPLDLADGELNEHASEMIYKSMV